MELAIVLVFIIGYFAIALEHNIHIDKAASSLALGVILWTMLVFGQESFFNIEDLMHHHQSFFKHFEELKIPLESNEVISKFIEFSLLEHLGEVAGILFFLIGAMTIVELIDIHNGFSVITDKIKTTNLVKLIWITGVLSFFLSAVLDNLTSTIVMISVLRKLIKSRKIRLYYAGVIVIAANAGGAWSPIGDVTTTMLWIGKQVTAGNIILKLIIPSIVTMAVPLTILSFTMKGSLPTPSRHSLIDLDSHGVNIKEKKIVFFAGVGGLLFVPIFKTITHLPPFMGMMFSLGIMWILTEVLHKGKTIEQKSNLNVLKALKKIDMASVLFFLGILLAIGSLQTAGTLTKAAGFLDSTLGNMYLINLLVGILSAIVDNVPLVAAAQGMYDLSVFPTDHLFWEFLAYCAGTGGSMLIIGSAAGVAAMGLERIDFVWYLKKMTLLAFSGYLAGAATFYFMFEILKLH
jgi:Na+/H+ antiporter NhaD/arsenite permease-like protein